MKVLQNSPTFRVGTRKLYFYPYPHPGILTRAYPYPGYCATGVQNLLGTGMNVVHNLQRFRVQVIPRVWFCKYSTKLNRFTYVCSVYEYFQVRVIPCVWFCTCPTEYRTQPFHVRKFRVRVWRSYKTHKCLRYGCETPVKPAKVTATLYES